MLIFDNDFLIKLLKSIIINVSFYWKNDNVILLMICMCVCIHMYMHTYIHTYTHNTREREREMMMIFCRIFSFKFLSYYVT